MSPSCHFFHIPRRMHSCLMHIAVLISTFPQAFLVVSGSGREFYQLQSQLLDIRFSCNHCSVGLGEWGEVASFCHALINKLGSTDAKPSCPLEFTGGLEGQWQSCVKEWQVSGWRDDSEIKSTVCSSRGPRFDCQHPYSSSQLSATLVPGESDTSRRCACRQNASAHNIKVLKKWQVSSNTWKGELTHPLSSV